MKYISCIIVFIAMCSVMVFADFKNDYQKLLDKKEYSKLESLLAKWQKAEPKNPELYIGYFNYHLSKAMKSGAAIDTILPADNKKPYMTLTDPKTGKVAGYLHDKTFYDVVDTQKALDYLNRGIAYGPNRLDMYFGKIHVLMEIHNYKDASECLSFILKHGNVINSNWLWSDNKKIDNGMIFLLENIQDYYNIWFSEDTEETNTCIKELSKTQIEQYPNHSWAYSNIFIAIQRLDPKEDVFIYIKKAYELDPQDMINVGNLANYYKKHNKTDEALKLYRIMASSKDTQVSEIGKKKIKEIEGK